jgi:hypothetical protein
MKIVVRYRSIDRCSKRGVFKTLAGAQRFAQKWVGETPDLGGTYAVSSDGIGKVTCDGCALIDLFPKLKEAEEREARWEQELVGWGPGLR